MAAMMKVVGYVRVSTFNQADQGSSLPAQKAKVAAYAAALDLEVVATLEDGISAATLDRPGLTAALAMLDCGAAQGLVVASLSRLTRSVKDLGTLIEDYFGEKHALFSVGDSIDTRSPGGRLVLNVLTSVAQWEREAVGQRTRETLAHLRQHGVKVGRAPLGYTYGEVVGPDGRRPLIAVAAELATVERIHALRDQGLTLQAIADALTGSGVPTKRGASKWSAKAVRDVLMRSQAQERACVTADGGAIP